LDAKEKLSACIHIGQSTGDKPEYLPLALSECGPRETVPASTIRVVRSRAAGLQSIVDVVVFSNMVTTMIFGVQSIVDIKCPVAPIPSTDGMRTSISQHDVWP
jgi:hypothetical protein